MILSTKKGFYFIYFILKKTLNKVAQEEINKFHVSDICKQLQYVISDT